jgi:hypothetical protein
MNLRPFSGGKNVSAYLAALLIGFVPLATQAQNLDQEKAQAKSLAQAQPSAPSDARATEIANSLGDAFGTQGDEDALLAKVTELCAQTPGQADAIAAAATAFKKTPEFLERLARAAGAGAPNSAGAIANAIKSAVPSANLASLQAAANEGANIGNAGGGGGGGSPGTPILPTAGGGGGGGGGGPAATPTPTPAPPDS